MALGDLRKLLQLIEVPKDVKYGQLGVSLYQRKGQDFSEEINSLFIKMCIRGKNLKVAAEELSTYENRLGAWTTPTSFHRLAEGLGFGRGAKLLTDAFDVVTQKGVKVSVASTELVLKACVEKGDAELHKKAAEGAARVLDSGALGELLVKYPQPAQIEVVAAEVAPAAERAT